MTGRRLLGLYLARCITSVAHYFSLMPYQKGTSPWETATFGATFYYLAAPVIGAFLASRVYEFQTGAATKQ